MTNTTNYPDCAKKRSRTGVKSKAFIFCFSLLIIVSAFCIVLALRTGDNLTETDAATASSPQNEKESIAQTLNELHYSDIQGDTPDEVFANFRKVTVGNLKDNTLYRSASPIDNSRNRAPIADRLIKDADIKYVINLSDDEKLLAYHTTKDDFNSPYYSSLYGSHKVIPLAMTSQFKEEAFSKGLVKGLTAMASHQGPYLVHCVEGKDRTGYVMMAIEALLGASYDEIVNDYMTTYDNYYAITKSNNEKHYNTIKENNIDVMLRYLINDEAGNKNLAEINDYFTYAKNHLLNLGMDEPTINQLIKNLSA